MNFHKTLRQRTHPVGADFIVRTANSLAKRRHTGYIANELAMRTMNRRLRDYHLLCC